MKKNWLLTTLLATVTIAMGTTTTAFASPPTDITPEHPGGVTAVSYTHLTLPTILLV